MELRMTLTFRILPSEASTKVIKGALANLAAMSEDSPLSSSVVITILRILGEGLGIDGMSVVKGRERL